MFNAKIYCKHRRVEVRIEILHKQIYEYDEKTGNLEMGEDTQKECRWDTAYYECTECGQGLSEREFMDLCCRECRELTVTQSQ
jgi:hypothetical protein